MNQKIISRFKKAFEIYANEKIKNIGKIRVSRNAVRKLNLMETTSKLFKK